VRTIKRVTIGIYLLGAVATWFFFNITDRDPGGKWRICRDFDAKFIVAGTWFLHFWTWNFEQLKLSYEEGKK